MWAAHPGFLRAAEEHGGCIVHDGDIVGSVTEGHHVVHALSLRHNVREAVHAWPRRVTGSFAKTPPLRRRLSSITSECVQVDQPCDGCYTEQAEWSRNGLSSSLTANRVAAPKSVQGSTIVVRAFHRDCEELAVAREFVACALLLSRVRRVASRELAQRSLVFGVMCALHNGIGREELRVKVESAV